MHITIRDNRGQVIESGNMSPFPEDPELWEYLPRARAPLGTTVIIQVTAIDCMGGVGRAWEKKPMGKRIGK